VEDERERSGTGGERQRGHAPDPFGECRAGEVSPGRDDEQELTGLHLAQQVGGPDQRRESDGEFICHARRPARSNLLAGRAGPIVIEGRLRLGDVRGDELPVGRVGENEREHGGLRPRSGETTEERRRLLDDLGLRTGIRAAHPRSDPQIPTKLTISPG